MKTTMFKKFFGFVKSVPSKAVKACKNFAVVAVGIVAFPFVGIINTAEFIYGVVYGIGSVVIDRVKKLFTKNQPESEVVC